MIKKVQQLGLTTRNMTHLTITNTNTNQVSQCQQQSLIILYLFFPEPDTYDYHRAPKINDFQDDFTRLSRLEIKIDDYIKRHHQLSIEINDIEQDLGLILNEFNDEFQDSIVKNDNKHTLKIGERILDKLNNFCSNDNSVVFKTAPYDGKTQQLPDRTFSPVSIPKSRKSSTESEQSNRVNQHLKTRKIPRPPPLPIAPVQAKMTASTLPTSPLTNSHNGHYQKNRDFTFNMTGIEKPNDSYGSPHLVKAHYAVVNTSTPYTEDAPSKLTHYKSTPSLAQQSMVYENSSSQYAPVDDAYIANNDPNQSRMYINMSMIMHSDHPVIEHCFRRIEILRPRIMGYKSEHKLSAYKDLSNEIWRLSNRLDTVDCGNDSIAQQDKNIAKCELFNLEGVLERAIQCTNEECVICNSFIYKQEVSV